MFDGTVPPGRSITFTFKPRGASIDSRFYKDHPEAVRNKIDSIAGGVLDPEGGHTIVIGFQSAGKSFLIEQFASNVEQYLARIKLDSLHIIDVARADAHSALNIPNGVRLYLDSATAILETEASSICFVTENPDFAAAIYAESPETKLILELNVATYLQLSGREQAGTSKIWSAWTLVDANEILLPFEELVATLENVMVPKLSEANLHALDANEIEQLVEFFLDQLPEAVYQPEDEDNESAGAILIPPGSWGIAVRRLATKLAFSSKKSLFDDEGVIVLDRVIEDVYSELEDDFEEILEMISMATDPEATVSGFPFDLGAGFRILTIGDPSTQAGEAEDDELKPAANPLQFADMTTLKAKLAKGILGQDHAVKAIVEGLSVPAAGIHDVTKPIRSFLFLGPTGVGKTQLAINLAEEAAEEPMNVIRLDMSEYAQAHEASKLLGAPSGYVGHEEGGVLTNAVFNNPRSLIILDEVEKAHYKIWDSFLQILDAGRMTDNKGRVVDFSQCIIVMTSNLGAKEAKMTTSLGFGTEAAAGDKARQAILAAVEGFFRPEMVNRIDELVYFDELSKATAREIVRREVAIVSTRMETKGYKLTTLDDTVIDEILKLSNFSKYGARDIQRAVIKNVSQPLAVRMLTKGRKAKKIALFVDADNKIQVK